MTVKIIQTTISERGEIQLPPEVLRLLGVGPKDRVEIAIEENDVRIVAPDRGEHPRPAEQDKDLRAARRRAALTGISSAFAHESVEEAEQAVAAAIAEVRAEARAARAKTSPDS